MRKQTLKAQQQQQKIGRFSLDGHNSIMGGGNDPFNSISIVIYWKAAPFVFPLLLTALTFSGHALGVLWIIWTPSTSFSSLSLSLPPSVPQHSNHSDERARLVHLSLSSRTADIYESLS